MNDPHLSCSYGNHDSYISKVSILSKQGVVHPVGDLSYFENSGVDQDVQTDWYTYRVVLANQRLR